MKRVKVSMNLGADLVKRCDALAKAEGSNRSRVIERFIVDGLGQADMLLRVFGNPALREAFAGAFGRPGVIRQLADAMGEQVGPEQMELFERAMRAAAETVAAGGKSRRARG